MKFQVILMENIDIEVKLKYSTNGGVHEHITLDLAWRSFELTYFYSM